jgi:hypothetical protein
MTTVFRREPIQTEQDRLPVSIEMHALAGRLGYSGMPKLSSINKRWFMEVDRIFSEDGVYTGTVYNVAMGTGDTPLEAAAHGYAQVSSEMVLYRVLCGVEALLPALHKRADAIKALDKTLTECAELVHSMQVQ